jgi:hypothetical protein
MVSYGQGELTALGSELERHGLSVRFASEAGELEAVMPGDRKPGMLIDRDGYAEARFWVDLSDPVKAAGRIAAVLAAADGAP